MIPTTKITAALLAASVMLAGCVDESFQEGGDREKTGQGAQTGALIGALAGLTQGDDTNDRLRNAAAGAAIGAGIGAGIGALLDRQARELRGSLDSEIDVINTGEELIVRMPQDILFAVDSAAVRPDLRNDLFALSDSLRRYPQSSVTVVGHTDNTGSAAYNQDLSLRRANAVTGVLTSAGVEPFRIRAFGAGEDSPIASNLSPEGRAQNRRVDITIRPN